MFFLHAAVIMSDKGEQSVYIVRSQINLSHFLVSLFHCFKPPPPPPHCKINMPVHFRSIVNETRRVTADGIDLLHDKRLFL